MEDNKNKIEEQETDNIYVYSEPEDNEPGNQERRNLDNSGPNYSQAYAFEEEEDVHADAYDNEKPSTSPLLLMFKVLLNPIEGWKSVRRERMKIEDVQQRCFYPLLGIFALSKFARLFYSNRVHLSEVLVSAISSFVSFFFSYFCIVLILKMIMSPTIKKGSNEEFAKIFVCICLSTLCLFFTTLDIFPMLWAILIFLPIWTIYIICRGARFFKFPNNRKTASTITLCLLIVAGPCLIEWLLEAILPK